MVTVLTIFFFPESLAAQPRQSAADSVPRKLSAEMEWIQPDTTGENEEFEKFEEYKEYDEAEQLKTPSSFLDRSLFTEKDSVEVRKLPDSLMAALRSDEDFWYANRSFYTVRQKEKLYYQGGENRFLNTLLWIIIIGGFTACVIWYLAGSNTGLFRKAPRRIAAEDEEAETDNIFLIHYRREIDKAVASGNYRLAVRLLYLQLLKKLSEKNIIHYRQELTNFDYQMQLSATPWYSDFQRATQLYEYSWYGQFEVPARLFEIIRKDFETFEEKINRIE